MHAFVVVPPNQNTQFWLPGTLLHRCCITIPSVGTGSSGSSGSSGGISWSLHSDIVTVGRGRLQRLQELEVQTVVRIVRHDVAHRDAARASLGQQRQVALRQFGGMASGNEHAHACTTCTPEHTSGVSRPDAARQQHVSCV